MLNLYVVISCVMLRSYLFSPCSICYYVIEVCGGFIIEGCWGENDRCMMMYLLELWKTKFEIDISTDLDFKERVCCLWWRRLLLLHFWVERNAAVIAEWRPPEQFVFFLLNSNDWGPLHYYCVHQLLWSGHWSYWSYLMLSYPVNNSLKFEDILTPVNIL